MQDVTKNVNWISENPEAATITMDGMATAIKAHQGKAIIKACSDHLCSKDSSLIIKPEIITGIEIVGGNQDIKLRWFPRQLEVLATFSNGEKRIITGAKWSSSKTSNVAVSKDGKISGKNIGGPQ
ncbi:hypothetical protein [Dongshaea marina]|uniref:hypothetical protein n=1 Tax=Dongshaea marina TaxID=2047966 RepID=UPI000D3E4C2F|nr:hypothetical protein [Dongshaea marina]